MNISEIFDLEATTYNQFYGIESERLKEISELIREPLVLSALNNNSTLEASINFFKSLKEKKLTVNELVYLSFVSGGAYNNLLEQSKKIDAKSV